MAGDTRRAAIARLNDRLRSTGLGGQIFLTAGVASLPEGELNEIVEAVRCFNNFTPDNDPYGEHDCASLVVAERRIIWKIDYYPPDDDSLDTNPADNFGTKRVMTIMLAEEY